VNYQSFLVNRQGHYDAMIMDSIILQSLPNARLYHYDTPKQILFLKGLEFQVTSICSHLGAFFSLLKLKSDPSEPFRWLASFL
jgi:hypothetical protein